MNKLFYCNLLNDNNTRIPVLIAHLVDEDYRNLLDFLTIDSNISHMLSLEPDHQIFVDVVSGVPVIALKPCALPKAIDFTQSYTVLTRCKDDDFAEAISIIAQRSANLVTTEEINYLAETCRNRIALYFQKLLPIKLSIRRTDYNTDTRDQIEAAKDAMTLASRSSSNYTGVAGNVTREQKDPSDLFYIKLPEYESLKEPVGVLNASLIPPMDQVFQPFPHIAYYGPFWRRLRNMTTPERVKYLTALQSAGDVPVTDSDIYSFVDVPIEEVIGHTDNDTLPIMDNEVDFYNSLIRFIRYDLDKSSRTPEIAEDLFNTGGLTPDMDGYIQDLIKEILYQNWVCTGKLPVRQFEEEESEDSINTSEIDNEFTYYVDDNPLFINGVTQVQCFISAMAQGKYDKEVGPIGCSAYAEAIVKLARWGVRRPKHLKFDRSEQMFDMDNCSLKVKSVDFTKLKSIPVNGKELSLGGIVNSKIAISDVDYFKSIDQSEIITCPIGFITVKFFEDGKSQVVYVSAIDVVDQYRSGNMFIDGIDYINGKFIVDQDRADSSIIDLGALNASVISSYDRVCYYSPELLSLCENMSIKAKSAGDFLSLVSILGSSDPFSKKESRWTVNSPESLLSVAKELKQQPLALILWNTAKTIVPVLANVTSTWVTGLYSDLLDLYANTLDSLGIKNGLSFYNSSAKTKAEVISDMNTIAAQETLKAMSAFSKLSQGTDPSVSSDSQNKVTPVVDESKQSPVSVVQTVQLDNKKEGRILRDITSLIVPVPDDAILYKVANIDNSIIGYLYPERKSDNTLKYILIGNKELKQTMKVDVSTVIPAQHLLNTLLGGLTTILLNTVDRSQVFFNSIETIQNFYAVSLGGK